MSTPLKPSHPPFEILPGVGIGPFRLGMTEHEIETICREYGLRNEGILRSGLFRFGVNRPFTKVRRWLDRWREDTEGTLCWRDRLTTSVAMKISGHRHARIFTRYSVVDTPDVAEAMRKVSPYEQEKRLARPKQVLKVRKPFSESDFAS